MTLERRGHEAFSSLNRPQFDQKDVLKVTGLAAATLQTWVNRGLVRLSEPNPGTGARRLYSALDCARLALMKRMTDFGVPVAGARLWVAPPVAFVASGREISNDAYYVVNDATATSGRKSDANLEPHHRILSGPPETISLQTLLETKNRLGDISDSVYVIAVGRVINGVFDALDDIIDEDA